MAKTFNKLRGVELKNVAERLSDCDSVFRQEIHFIADDYDLDESDLFRQAIASMLANETEVYKAFNPAKKPSIVTPTKKVIV